MLRVLGCALYGTPLLVSATAKGVYEPMVYAHESRHLEARQATPITMTSTNCPASDGLFYITSNNYTYQIQCATTYNGQQIMTQTAQGFTACILQCASYNHDNPMSTLFCVGVNFNAATDSSSGDCTLFDEISPVPNEASEEGNTEDAALLIYGPMGQTFATPEPQPSNVVEGILSNSLVFTSQPLPVSTAFVTSMVTVISCATGIWNCPANGLSTSTSMFTTSAVLSLASPSVSISLGGMRPLSTSSPLLPDSTPASSGKTITTNTVSYSSRSVTLQATQTSIVPYTEYRVTTVVSCAHDPTTTSCNTSASTQIITGLRTEISCSPGTCSGVMLATGTLAGMPGIFTGGCIVEWI